MYEPNRKRKKLKKLRMQHEKNRRAQFELYTIVVEHITEPGDAPEYAPHFAAQIWSAVLQYVGTECTMSACLQDNTSTAALISLPIADDKHAMGLLDMLKSGACDHMSIRVLPGDRVTTLATTLESTSTTGTNLDWRAVINQEPNPD